MNTQFFLEEYNSLTSTKIVHYMPRPTCLNLPSIHYRKTRGKGLDLSTDSGFKTELYC